MQLGQLLDVLAHRLTAVAPRGARAPPPLHHQRLVYRLPSRPQQLAQQSPSPAQPGLLPAARPVGSPSSGQGQAMDQCEDSSDISAPAGVEGGAESCEPAHQLDAAWLQHSVRSVLFALEPPAAGHAGARSTHNYDAVFLHRPWQLQPRDFARSVVLFNHEELDNYMAIGWNPALAVRLGLEVGSADSLAQVWWANKRGVERCVGMAGALAGDPTSLDAFVAQARAVFGSLEHVAAHGAQRVARVAVMGAMNEALLRRAHAEHGADVYVTGQLRPAALPVAAQLGVAVVAAGHAAGELWGLRALAESVREAQGKHGWEPCRIDVAD